MIKTYKHNDLEWIDLVSPSQDEVRSLYEKYNLPPAVAENLLTPSVQPKTDRYDTCLYMALHFPTKQKKGSGMENQEMDFCIGKNFLITTRASEFGSVHEFSKMFEVNSILGKSKEFKHAGYLFYYLMRHLYSTLGLELALITSGLGDIENKIFGGKEREMVIALSSLSRTALDFKRSMRLHGAVLESLFSAGKSFFADEEFGFYFKSILTEFYTIDETASATLESIRELRDTNDSLVSTKQNEVVQILTVVAFMALPLTVISALFQIDAVSRPIIGHPGDFWILVIMMLVIIVGLYGYFKHKKWL